jgi:hypothetical protein
MPRSQLPRTAYSVLRWRFDLDTRVSPKSLETFITDTNAAGIVCADRRVAF